MKEFFDFHLKDKPAPEWLNKGVAWLKMEDHLKERAALVRPAEVKAEAKADDKKNVDGKPAAGNWCRNQRLQVKGFASASIKNLESISRFFILCILLFVLF